MHDHQQPQSPYSSPNSNPSNRSPNSCNRSPNSCNTSPNSCNTSLNSCITSPNSCNTSPNSFNTSPNRHKMTLSTSWLRMSATFSARHSWSHILSLTHHLILAHHLVRRVVQKPPMCMHSSPTARVAFTLYAPKRASTGWCTTLSTGSKSTTNSSVIPNSWP